MKRIVAITLILSLSVAALEVPAFAQGGLNPDFAAALSVLVPGLGQVYAGETARGLLFLAGEGAMFLVGATLIRLALREPMRESLGRNVADVVGTDGKTYRVIVVPSREEARERASQVLGDLDGGQIALIATGAILILGGIAIHAWGAADAYNSVGR